MDSGKYEEAINGFSALNGYSDSKTLIRICETAITLKDFSNIKVGQTITYGSYEQDNDTYNGAEAIEWIVLARDGNRILVISKYALDCIKYKDFGTDTTWETCSLRDWLNSTFLNAAFSEAEQTFINTVTVTAESNPNYDTDPGNDTQDQIFALSISEADKYFTSDSARKCSPTEYAEEKVSAVNSYIDGCQWWLRTPSQSNCAVHIETGGAINYSGQNVNNRVTCVRPAMWINLPS